MNKWNNITKQIKKFLAEHPDAPYEIRISNGCFEAWNRQCFNCIGKQNWDVKVVMRKYLQPEEDLEVDGIGIEQKELLF